MHPRAVFQNPVSVFLATMFTAVLLSSAASTSLAQVVGVTASQGTASANYSTLGAAFTAINGGIHQGTIVITIAGTTTETVTDTLFATGTGPRSYTSITISPAAAVAAVVIGAVAGPLVDLNGATNATIDGLNTGGSSLRIENTSATATASTIRFINGASANAVQNCTVNGAGIAATTGVIAFSTTTAATGNSRNLVTACDIGPSGANLPMVGVYSSGTTTSTALYDSLNTISNNLIHDTFSATASASVYGVELLTGNTDWTVSGNSVYQSATRSPAVAGTMYGIYLSSTLNGNNFAITGNSVGGTAPSAGGTPLTVNAGTNAYTFAGIYASATSASVQGNTVTNFAWTSGGTTLWRGIYAASGTLNIGTVTGNTIGAGTGTGAVTVSSTATGALSVYGIDVAAGNVSNNTIGGITLNGVSLSFAGINSSATGASTFANNLIGSLSTAGSISLTSPTVNAVTLFGISLTGGAGSAANPLAVTGNTIANLTSAAVTAGGRAVHGIELNTTATFYYSIAGNTIRNLSAAAGGTNIPPANAPIAGIGVNTTGTGSVNILQNTVYSLGSTSAASAVVVEGIGVTINPSFGSATVTRNIVHSLTAVSSATCTLVGIASISGARYVNNMVRLGLDANGSPVSGPHTFVGMGADGGLGGGAYYFNTVWIGGSAASGAANSYAFWRSTSYTDTLKDNIFVNLRTGGTGRNFALSVIGGAASKFSDYNLYWTGGSANVASVNKDTTSLGTLQAIRATGSGWEAHSGLGDPLLVAPAAAAGSMSLRLQPVTPAEGTGIDPGITGLTDIDQAGDLRASYTPTDIGADAGLYAQSASTDVFPPTITMTALANTSLTTDRTFTATVADVGTGVPTSGSLVPRVWYRKSTSGTWALSAPGTLTGGSGSGGTWSFTISAASLLPAPGDSIQYYVVAEDQATSPNLWFQPIAATSPVQSDVNTPPSTPPSAPLGYRIVSALAGTYYVPSGPGTAFTSLTNAGGLFATVNGGTLSGNVTVVVTGDVTESGANALNSWLEDGTGGYTLTIQPDAATLHTLSGTAVASATPMINLNGARRVTIDGSFGASGQYLKLRNTNATAASCGPTVQFNNGANGDALKNCIVESNASATTTAEVLIGATGANTNITISGNDLRDPTGGTAGSPANLVGGNSAGISVITISNNSLHNFSFAGVDFGGFTGQSTWVAGSGITISGNSLYNDAATATGPQCMIGIGGAASDGDVVSGNYLGGRAPLCGGVAWPYPGSSNYDCAIGLRTGGTTLGASIQGNTIQNIAFSGLNGFYGITTQYGAGRFAIGTVTGNTIGHPTTASSLTFAVGTQAPQVVGIFAASGGQLDVQNNVIANLTASSAVSTVAPYLYGGIYLNPTVAGSNVTVENNTLKNLSFTGNSGTGSNGIAIAAGSAAANYDVGGSAGNTISGLSFGTSAICTGMSISTSSLAGLVISHNTLSGISNTGTGVFYGISASVPYNASQSLVQNNTIQGVTLAGSEFRGISLTGGTTGFGPASVTGNLVGSDTSPNSISVSGTGVTTGIWVEGYNNSYTGLLDLSNCTVANMTASGTGTGVAVRGIYSGLAGGTATSGGYVGMSGVSIHDLATASTSTGDGATAPAVAGIWLMGAQTPYVQNTSIHALRATTVAAAVVAVDGIYVNGGIGSLQRDRVWDLTCTSASATATIRGVYEYGGSWTLANDEISLTNGANANPVQLQGIAQNIAASAGAGNLYYNSVYVGGSQSSGASNSFAFVRQGSYVDLLQDNLLYNGRANTGTATGSHYAAGSALPGIWTSNYNVLVGSNAAKLGQWVGADKTLATWQSASGGDASSPGETSANVPAAQLFTDPANGVLDIKPTTAYDVPPIVSNAGQPVAGITTDFGGLNARSISYPDIGASEITVSRTLTAAGTLAPASPAYPGNYDDVIVSGAGAPSLSGNVNVFGNLSLAGGDLTTNAYSVTIRPSGSVSRTSGSVTGNLAKYFATGGYDAATFEVGSSGAYTPVDLALAPVSTAGYVTATTAGTEHPHLATSILDGARDANRYWTLTNAGTAFGAATVTPHFVAADLDAGADPASFVAGQYNGTSWAYPAVGTRTTTSTQATGLASLGDFALGDPSPVTITATAGTNGSISPSGAVSVAFGASQAFTIAPNAHYHVADVLVDGAGVGAVTTYTFTNAVANHTISATFSADTNPIAATSGANGTVTPAGTTNVAYGASQAYAITPAAHYHVADVLVDGASAGAVTAYTFTNVTAGHTISATFALDTNPIAATSGANGSVTPAGTTQVPYGGSQAYAITAGTGYSVADVQVDGASAGAVTAYTFSNVTAAHTISATFVLNTLTITASAGANGTVSPAGATAVGYGGGQAYAITPAAHYHVADVLVDGASVGAVTSYTFTNVTAGHTISATFAIDTNPIAATSGANGSVTPAGTTAVGYGGSQAYAITPDSHYHVADVLVDGASAGAVTAYTFTGVTSGHTISATFAPDTYAITASAGSNGSVTPAGATNVNWNASQVYAITPDAHYHVADVLVDGASAGAVTAYTFSNVAATHTISATFAIDTYTITASASAGGSIAPSGVTTLAWNGAQTYTLAADPGYVLVSLLVDGAAAGTPASYSFSGVSANHTISAQYQPIMNPAPVSAGSPAGALSSTTASLVVPVTISRNYPNPLRAFHVTFHLSPELTLTGGTSGIAEGGFLASGGYTTTFQVIDEGGGSYSADGSVLGAGCNTTALTGTLFNVPVSSSAASGTGSVTITAVTLRDCANSPLPGTTGSAASVAIDNSPPTASLTSPAGGEFFVAGSQHAITWSAADNVGVTAVDLALSLDGGATWPAAIATGIANSGSFTWTVPSTLSPAARVRVTAHDAAGNTGSAASAASFTIGQWSLAATAGAHGAVTPAGTTGVNQGGSQAYAITPDAHYHVADVLVDGASVGTVTAYTFSGVTANHTISATFAIDVNAVTASSGANGSVTPAGTTSVPYGAPQAYAITPDAHYHVADVLVDGASVGAVTAYTFTNVTAAHTISATFAIDVNAVTASSGANGSVTPAGTTSVPYGAPQAYAITPDAHYHVADVLVDGASVGAVTAYTFTSVTASHTISATFAIDVNAVTASSGANGSVTPAGTTSVPYGAPQAYAITPDAHYHVADVLVDGASVGAVTTYTFTSVTANHTISATFAIDTNAITATSGANGSVTPAGTTPVAYGADQAFAITPDTHYHVADVLVDGASVGPVTSYTFTNVTASHTISATFAIDVNTITAASGANGTVTPAGATSVPYGGSQAYAVTPAAHYHVADVLVDGVSAGTVTAYTFTNVTAAHTISATFAIDVNAITATSGDNGSVTPAGATNVPYGGSQAYAITPAAHYHVVDVLVDGGSAGAVTAYTFTNVTASHTISATFAIDVNAITATSGANGSVTPAGTTVVPYGADQAYAITPAAHYHVADVLVDGASVGAPTAYTFSAVTAGHTISATFVLDSYTITASATAGGSITPSGAVAVDWNGTQGFAMAADPHFHLGDVLVDGLSVGAVTGYSFAAVSANHTIAAVFVANPPVAAITTLAATQIRSGNVPGNTTAISVTWSGVAAGSTVEVYRSGFGNYPLYASGATPGSVPAVPAAYPPPGWTLTSVHQSGDQDVPDTRDFCYYVAYVTDVYGTVSPVSNRTGGTLDYHLGDVTNGITLGVGDSHVTLADLSLLGAHYGTTNVGATAWNYLDVGPTTDLSLSAMPTADGRLDFEDLVVFAINFEAVSGPQDGGNLVAAAADGLSLEAPDQVSRGDVLTLRLRLSGTGSVRALSAALGWDPAIVAPAGFGAGSMIAAQGGAMFSAAPGSVDGALLGSDRRGFLGEGEFATLSFRARANGAPKFTFAHVDARGAANSKLAVATSYRVTPRVPLVTSLSAPAPNPAPGGTTIAFGLSRSGPVDLALYSVDGRRVRTLAHGQHEADMYRIGWDGRDDSGRAAAPGVYYARLTTAQGTFTRSVVLLN